MNGLVKILILLAIVYFGYKYWKENISPQGIKDKKLKDTVDYKAMSELAARLQTEDWAVQDASCNERYQAGVYEWTDVARCKTTAKMLNNQQDWGAIAKAQLGQ